MPTQQMLNKLYASESRQVIGPKGGILGAGKTLSRPERLVIRTAKELVKERPDRVVRYLEVGVGSALLFDTINSLRYETHGVEPGNWGKRPNVVGFHFGSKR